MSLLNESPSTQYWSLQDLVQFSDLSSSQALATTVNAAGELPLYRTYHTFTIRPTTIHGISSVNLHLSHATLSRISTSWLPGFSASSSRYPVPFGSTNLARVTASFHSPFGSTAFPKLTAPTPLSSSSASKGKNLQNLTALANYALQKSEQMEGASWKHREIEEFSELKQIYVKFFFVMKAYQNISKKSRLDDIKSLVLSNELINVELPPWKIYKADVSSVSWRFER